MTKRRRARRACVRLAALLALLVAPTEASAHAVLLKTEPSNDSIVAEAPGRVRLEFNEPVETAFGSVRVHDSEARRVDGAELERPSPETVEAPIDRALARGTYTVTWRAISADGHPISGAFVFHVRTPGANPTGIAGILDDDAPRSVAVARTVVRFLDFALLLAVAGGCLTLIWVLETAGDRVKRRVSRVVAACAAGLVVVALAGIVLHGAAAAGLGFADALDWSVVSAVLETRFGEVWLVQAVLAAATAILASWGLRGRARELTGAVLLLLAGALLITPSAAGHARVDGGLTFVVDSVHVLAAAAWAGGLAFLVLGLLSAGEDRWPLAARAVPRFSALAVVTASAVIVAGVVNAYLEVRALRGLWETTYGLLVLAKVGLVVPLIALGAYNNRYAVPRLRQAIASFAEQRRFLRAVGVELALMVAIVGVTAFLVVEPPAKATVAPRGPYAADVRLGSLTANVVVDPARAGRNAVHLYLIDSTGRPAEVLDPRWAASLPSKEVGPLRFRPRRLAPGHYSAFGVDLALAGDWQLRLDARRGEFEAIEETISIPIRED